MSFFGDVDPDEYMRHFRAESDRVRRMFENSVPQPKPETIFTGWLKYLRDYFRKESTQ